MSIFEGRVSIVTGASQGIGEAVALDLAAAGAAVVLVDVQKEKLEAVAAAIAAAGGRADVQPADVGDAARAQEIAEAALAAHGRIDHLVNNAGITRDALLVRMREEDWDAVLRVNLKGTFNFSKAVVRAMMGARWGRIVNIASVVGLMGNAGQANYAASKAGVIAFTKSLAREVAARGVTVNAVAPGYVATAMTERLPEEVKKTFLEIIPMKKFGLPKDVVSAVRFLLSDDASYITGQVISVNGGMYM
ncbi:MAG TPA: 3-oxoacyl-[acyl-carrier-protein] reductase [Terriglobales bacterium]|nr:3-oxoacyl-[acyl-carrier-protein] reductase [Terriglobales bacterium]